MEQKSQFLYNKHETVGDDQTKSKKAVLDQFHHMEWMKNKSGSQVSRSNSKGNHEGRMKKKEEENYFEGTTSQKKGKARRLRPAESVSATIRLTTGFASPATSTNSGPPPVNAWSKKRGSELFSKARVGVEDEEERMLELALQESIKTAKQDEERHLQRLQMMNKYEPSQLVGKDRHTDNTNSNYDRQQDFQPGRLSSSSKTLSEVEEWDDAFDNDGYDNDDKYCANISSVNQSTDSQLQFVDTDLSSEPPVKTHRKKLLPPRKASEKLTNSSTGTVPVKNSIPNETFYSPDPPCSDEIFKTPEYETYDSASCQSEKQAINIGYDKEIENPITSLTYNRKISDIQLKGGMTIPEKGLGSKSGTSNLNLDEHFTSKLTFGDTQGLFDQIQENDIGSIPSDPFKYPFQGQDFNQMNISTYKESPSDIQLNDRDSTTLSDSAETDFILHHFIRHEPPPGLPSNNDSMQERILPNEMFPLNNMQQSTPTMGSSTDEMQSFINGINSESAKSLSIPSNGQGSRSSLASESPLQNVTPCGTPQNCQPSHQININGHHNNEGLDNVFGGQMTNHHNLLGPTSTYPSIPGFMAPHHGVFAVNPQLIAIPPYGLSNHNVMMPQDVNSNPHLLHSHLNLMALNMHQYQQAHLAALGAEEKRAQVSPHSQNQGAFDQNHSVLENDVTHDKTFPRVIPTQNQIYDSQTQTIPTQFQNASPMTSGGHNQPLQQPPIQINQSYKPELTDRQPPPGIYSKEYFQQQQTPGSQQIIQENSNADLHRAYYETLQKLQQIQQEMKTSQLGTPPISIPHHQPFIYPPPGVSLNMYPMGAVPNPAHYSQGFSPEQASPPNDVDEKCPNIQPSTQLPLKPLVGRGRGRIQH